MSRSAISVALSVPPVRLYRDCISPDRDKRNPIFEAALSNFTSRHHAEVRFPFKVFTIPIFATSREAVSNYL